MRRLAPCQPASLLFETDSFFSKSSLGSPSYWISHRRFSSSSRLTFVLIGINITFSIINIVLYSGLIIPPVLQPAQPAYTTTFLGKTLRLLGLPVVWACPACLRACWLARVRLYLYTIFIIYS